MKSHTRIRLVVALTFVAAIAGCGLAADNKEAREIGSKFYDALKAGDANTAASYCVTDPQMTLEAWQSVFSQNLNMMGKVTSYETGKSFDVSQSNGVSTVKVIYNVTYEYGTSTDSIIFQNAGKGFLVQMYSPEIQTAVFRDELAKSKQIASDYLNAVSKNDMEKAFGYIGYSGKEKHTPEEWVNFFNYIETNAGKMVNFEIISDSCYTYLHDTHEEAGQGNIYSIYINTQYSGGAATNRIDVFQPEFGQDLKVVAHHIN